MNKLEWLLKDEYGVMARTNDSDTVEVYKDTFAQLLAVAEAAAQVLEQDFTTPGGMSGYRLLEKALKPLLEESE